MSFLISWNECGGVAAAKVGAAATKSFSTIGEATNGGGGGVSGWGGGGGWCKSIILVNKYIE